MAKNKLSKLTHFAKLSKDHLIVYAKDSTPDIKRKTLEMIWQRSAEDCSGGKIKWNNKYERRSEEALKDLKETKSKHCPEEFRAALLCALDKIKSGKNTYITLIEFSSYIRVQIFKVDGKNVSQEKRFRFKT